ADQFGWEEMAAAVGSAYNSLAPDVRAKTAIFGQNYGQAGAIDLFGPKYGIPQGSAISGHQSYYLWGPHGYTGGSMIVMDDRPERLAEVFTTFRTVARVSHPLSSAKTSCEVLVACHLRFCRLCDPTAHARNSFEGDADSLWRIPRCIGLSSA